MSSGDEFDQISEKKFLLPRIRPFACAYWLVLQGCMRRLRKNDSA